jgi:hypothetical protein
VLSATISKQFGSSKNIAVLFLSIRFLPGSNGSSQTRGNTTVDLPQTEAIGRISIGVEGQNGSCVVNEKHPDSFDLLAQLGKMWTYLCSTVPDIHIITCINYDCAGPYSVAQRQTLNFTLYDKSLIEYHQHVYMYIYIAWQWLDQQSLNLGRQNERDCETDFSNFITLISIITKKEAKDKRQKNGKQSNFRVRSVHSTRGSSRSS